MQISGRAEHFHALRAALAGISRLLADEQDDFVSARGEIIGEFRAKPARGKIREPAHVVQRLERRPGGDDAIHAAKIDDGGWRMEARITPAGFTGGKLFGLRWQSPAATPLSDGQIR